jgi:hypothetical protein
MRHSVFLLATLPLLSVSLDDTTISLLSQAMIPAEAPARRPSDLAFVQLGSDRPSSGGYSDESHVPVSGIQIVDPTLIEGGKRLASRVIGSSLRRHDKQKILVARHTGKAVVSSTPAYATPDVYLCYIPAGGNRLSGRNCDMSSAGSVMVLAQTLRCTTAVHPRTVSDLMNGAQTSPVDIAAGQAQAEADLASMDVPVLIDVSAGSCSQPRRELPDLALDKNYFTLVLVNPDVQRAAETFTTIGPNRVAAFRAGLIFLDTHMLYDPSAQLRGLVATKFQNEVAECAADGICTSKELVAWTPTGDRHVDWFVGSSETIVRFH